MAKLKVPKNYSEVTVGQAMDWHATPDKTEALAKIAGVSLEELRHMPHLVVSSAVAHLAARVFDQPTGEFLPIVEIDGAKYGFIVDWEKISVGEWVDLEHYTGQDPWKAADAVLAILYREIEWHDPKTGLYRVKPYENTSGRRRMRDLPAAQFTGAVFFFVNTAIDFENDGLYSIQQRVRRMKKLTRRLQSTGWLRGLSSIVGAGLRRLWRRLKEISSGLMRSLSSPFRSSSSGKPTSRTKDQSSSKS